MPTHVSSIVIYIFNSITFDEPHRFCKLYTWSINIIYHKADTVVPDECTQKNCKCSFYVPNRVLHKDLNVPTVVDQASTRYKSFHSSFHLHTNPLVKALSSYTQRGIGQGTSSSSDSEVKCIDRVVPVGDYLTRRTRQCTAVYTFCLLH